ncbi:MAG: hypothetical protein AAGA11_08495 [Pseudomonadota bacterium]
MTHMNPTFLVAFGGTAVEFFETVVIAYAIARAGYPREAVSATVLGHAVVFALALTLVPLHAALPVFWLRLAAALMLCTMGGYWALKSGRRLLAGERPGWVEDPLGKVDATPATHAAHAFSPWVFLAMAKSSVIEAGEILVIVFPAAAGSGEWSQAVAGVVAGIFAVLLAVAALHRQLKRVPEVVFKLSVGLVLFVIGLRWLLDVLRGG